MSIISVIAPRHCHEPWLRYTLDLLGDLAGLTARLVLVAPEEAPPGGKKIYYSSKPTKDPEGIWIPCRPDAGKFELTSVRAGREVNSRELN